MNPKSRRQLLFVALAATLVASFWPEAEEPPQARIDAKKPVKRQAAMPINAPQTTPRPIYPEAEMDLFQPRSWRPQPATGTNTVIDEVAPEPPPIPFRHIGRWREAGVERAVLERGEKTLNVYLGDVIDGLYRVDAITPNEVVITYLPMQRQQRLGVLQ